MLLEVHGLSMRFGGLLAVDNLSFGAKQGAITSIIGPNGAGKTTVFNCVTGFYRATSGQILAEGREIQSWPGDKIVREAHIARTFQNIRLFPYMTALENLLVARHNGLMRASHYCLAGLLHLPSYRETEKMAVRAAKDWLSTVGLADCADVVAGSLPYGAQRRLEIARAMNAAPKLICLDEPAAGLNPRETEELNRMLLSIRRDYDTSILLIEHDMRVVMQISDHVVVLDYGRKIAEGAPQAVQKDPNVIRAYLGEEHA